MQHTVVRATVALHTEVCEKLIPSSTDLIIQEARCDRNPIVSPSTKKKMTLTVLLAKTSATLMCTRRPLKPDAFNPKKTSWTCQARCD